LQQHLAAQFGPSASGGAEVSTKAALTARTEAEINATAEAIVRNGARAIAVPGDVTERQAVERAVATTEAELGPIDVLINNAGVLTGGLIGTIDADEWWRDIDIHLRGPFLFVNAVLPAMVARRHGRIINLASGAGHQAIETGAAYCVSKAALIGLSEIIALETTKHGLAPFAIHPGTVLFDILSCCRIAWSDVSTRLLKAPTFINAIQGGTEKSSKQAKIVYNMARLFVLFPLFADTRT
jgi:NAD(P)-dependent dehydrogenase (short-subunit alcohol dehydrogenase family)